MPIEMRCESFGQFCERVKSEGRWAEYAKRIVALRAEGMNAMQARGKAMPEFGGVPSQRAQIAAVQAPKQKAKAPRAEPKIPTPEKADGPDIVEITRAMFEGKDCDERECVQFVFENMDVADVTPDMAPSSGAWSLLQMCRKYPSFRAEFYKTIWPKLLPTKSQMDLQNQFADDGRDAQELITKMKQQIAENPA